MFGWTEIFLILRTMILLITKLIILILAFLSFLVAKLSVREQYQNFLNLGQAPLS
jgi:hypothetical protein